MKSTEFKVIYDNLKSKFDIYAESVFSSINTDSDLAEAMKYSFTAGGKRIRPVLMLAIAGGLGVSDGDVLPFAFALECLHTYSLIHDDLPALDNDTLRRGKPTSHVKFGEATAILAGDALLNLAFEHTLEKCDNKAKVTALSYLAACAGYKGMLEGQALDIKNEKKGEISEETLFAIIERKTSKFIQSAAVIPALLSGADIAAYEEFGKTLGILFQFCDDLKDVVSTADELGKSVGKDELEDKPSAVKVYGVEELKKQIISFDKKCKNISKLLVLSDFLQCFITYVSGYEAA